MLEPFVDVGWCLNNRQAITIADVRWYLDGRAGAGAYAAGHIPGAIFVDLDTVLSEPHDDDRAGRHPLPTPERFAGGLAALGIGDQNTVVAYDDLGGIVAARLVWLLRATGHDAALLDGGLAAWPAAALEQGAPPARPPQRFKAVPWPAGRLASIDEVAAGDHILIDARDRERFAGGPDPVDPRSGHIPGARSVPVREQLQPDGRLLSRERLRESFAAAGIGAVTPVISYCGSGVSACLNLLLLEHTRLAEGRLYPGSWSQWSRDDSRPVATGGR